ncbi:MAG: hypothetical protein AAF228_09355 [Pseudomonadota bacterium]
MSLELTKNNKLSTQNSQSLTMVDVIIMLNAIQEELSRDVVTRSLASVVRDVSKELNEIREIAVQVAQEKDAIRH